MSFHIVIPARLNAKRFPGKLLKCWQNKPIILHTYERALKANADSVTIATDDPQIQSLCLDAGATVLMTRGDHTSGTDRIAEVAYELNFKASDIIVNVQGDEPQIDPKAINQVAALLQADASADCASLYREFNNLDEVHNPNMVKCITDINQYALYFSRAAIPAMRESATIKASTFKHHIGIYAYTVKCLQAFTELPPCDIEHIEKLEQLRLLWNGFTIKCAKACVDIPAGIDSPEDLLRLNTQPIH